MNLAYLEATFPDGATVTPEALAQHGVQTRGTRGIKILGSGALSKKLTVQAHAFSASALRGITRAGGTAVRLAA